MLLEVRERIAPPEHVTQFVVNPQRDGMGRAPADVTDFFSAISGKQSSACQRALELLRWRYRYDAPHRPYSILGTEWSRDGEEWTRAPVRVHLSARLVSGFDLTPEVAAGAQVLANSGLSEPVAHQLLREAIDVSGGNPRSALVIAVAAVETGFKHLVADLVPDAAWLVAEAPSPPIVRMLVRYLPLLPTRARIDGVVLPPPKYARTLLEEAVKDRNDVVHSGLVDMSDDDLSQTSCS